MGISVPFCGCNPKLFGIHIAKLPADSPITTLFSPLCVAKATDLPKVALSLEIPPEVPKWRADPLTRREVQRVMAIPLTRSAR